MLVVEAALGEQDGQPLRVAQRSSGAPRSARAPRRSITRRRAARSLIRCEIERTSGSGSTDLATERSIGPTLTRLLAPGQPVGDAADRLEGLASEATFSSSRSSEAASRSSDPLSLEAGLELVRPGRSASCCWTSTRIGIAYSIAHPSHAGSTPCLGDLGTAVASAMLAMCSLERPQRARVLGDACDRRLHGAAASASPRRSRRSARAAAAGRGARRATSAGMADQRGRARCGTLPGLARRRRFPPDDPPCSPAGSCSGLGAPGRACSLIARQRRAAAARAVDGRRPRGGRAPRRPARGHVGGAPGEGRRSSATACARSSRPSASSTRSGAPGEVTGTFRDPRRPRPERPSWRPTWPSLRSDEGRRDQALRDRGIETARFPTRDVRARRRRSRSAAPRDARPRRADAARPDRARSSPRVRGQRLGERHDRAGRLRADRVRALRHRAAERRRLRHRARRRRARVQAPSPRRPELPLQERTGDPPITGAT